MSSMERVAASLGDTSPRVLIVGAGIAGTTLAGLLRRRNQPAAVIERQAPQSAEGYMLGLLPLGGRVLESLGLTSAYLRASVPMRNYDLYDRRGRRIRRYPLDQLVAKFGEWRGIERTALLEILHPTAGPIVYETTVTSLQETADGISVQFDDGSTGAFDLVVGADGIHSAIRGLTLPPHQMSEVETGWGGYVAWAPQGSIPSDTYSELWADGWGVGLYPVPGRVGVFLAGLNRDLTGMDPVTYADELSRRVPSEPFGKALANVQHGDQFYWRMSDIRARQWRTGRVLLLGDAAAAFLPTAGVGASAAMDSAAALAGALSGASADDLGAVLDKYELQQRPRVEQLQDNSRNLARWMFVDSRPVAALRDAAAHFYSLRMLTRGITRAMEGH